MLKKKSPGWWSNLPGTLYLTTERLLPLKSIANAIESSTAPVISLSIPRTQVFSAIEKLNLSHGAKAFLRELNARRNPKTGGKAYGKIDKFAAQFNVDRRTIRNWIIESEAAGYLYVEGQHNGKKQICNAYHFTALIFNPTDEALQKAILAVPFRKSRVQDPTQPHRQNTRLEPRLFQVHPGGKKIPPKTLSLPQENSKSILDTTKNISLTVSKPPTKPAESNPVVLDMVSQPIGDEEKIAEAEKVLEVYEAHFKKPSPVTRVGFVRNFIKNKIPADKLIADIKTLAGDILYGDTFSPNRLWEFDSRAKPIRDMVLKRTKQVLKSSFDMESALVSLGDDKAISGHFNHDFDKFESAINYVSRQMENQWQEEQRREAVECPEFVECVDY